MSDDPFAVFRALLRGRRTVRRYRREHPGRQRIADLVALAATAPSASNQQAWRFVAMDDRPAIDHVAAAVGVASERISTHVDSRFRTAFDAYGDYFTRFREAPVVIAVAGRTSAVLSHLVDGTLLAEDARHIAAMEDRSTWLSLGLAVGNLVLAAHASGLAASILTGPLIAGDDLQRAFGLPTSWPIGCLVTLGFSDEVPAPTARKPLTTILRWHDPAPGDHPDA